MGEIHDLMPITLDRDIWSVWLDPEVQVVNALQTLLVPSQDERQGDSRAE